jgi:hypothetical protein
LEEVKVSVYKQKNPYTNFKTARSLYATSYSIKHPEALSPGYIYEFPGYKTSH